MLDNLTQEALVDILTHGITWEEVPRAVLAGGAASLPNCGGGALFSYCVRMRGRCQIFLGALVYTWPTPPWDALLYGDVAFLAFDSIFRPPAPEDFGGLLEVAQGVAERSISLV